MRRWGDQADPRAREAQLRDHLVDLVARQLSALAGLGPLRYFDLQDFGIGQVLRRDAKAPRSHLLDLGVLLSAVARGVFPALARVGAAP